MKGHIGDGGSAIITRGDGGSAHLGHGPCMSSRRKGGADHITPIDQTIITGQVLGVGIVHTI